MTPYTRAPASRSLPATRPAASAPRRTVLLARGLLIGGGILGCAAVTFVLSQPRGPAHPVASGITHTASTLSPRLRVVAAPTAARFAANTVPAVGQAISPARRPSADNSSAGHAAAVRPSAGRTAVRSARLHRDDAAAASGSARLAVDLGHLLVAAQYGKAATFLPARAWPEPAAASTLVAALAIPRPDRIPVDAQTATDAADDDASPVSRAVSEAAPDVELAMATPSRVPLPGDVALQDLPQDLTAPPRDAQAALEREIALAVPTPTARPFKPALAGPLLRPRERAPAGLMAYARPDAGALDDETMGPARSAPSISPLRPGTAVYDISAATVYLPSGERLEAHSGLGVMRDNARYVRAKNRGPTPPHTYTLRMREKLFHGVAAIRLNPVGGAGAIHNRVGLLAHTYMLGKRGDSNGCVSFKNYKRFLAAFKRGEIDRLVVVESYNPPSRLASLFNWARR